MRAGKPPVGPRAADTVGQSVGRGLRVEHLGCIDYATGLMHQARCADMVAAGQTVDTLLLLAHFAVVTTGRRVNLAHLKVSAAELARRGIAYVQTGRGGDVTYHGPGQLVGYPILALQAGEQDLRDYVRRLEEAIIRTVADFGVTAHRTAGLRGVWVGQDKLAAIGVRVARWVTSHGFALNIDPDPGGFALIVPCGLAGRGVISLAQLCPRTPPRDAVAESFVGHFAEVFGRSLKAR